MRLAQAGRGGLDLRRGALHGRGDRLEELDRATAGLEDRAIRGLEIRALVPERLEAATLAGVTGQLPDPLQASALASHGRVDDLRPEARPVLPHPPPFVPELSLVRREPEHPGGHLVRPVFGRERVGEVAADDVLRVEAEQARCAAVPVDDPSLRVQGVDRAVPRSLHHPSVPLLARAQRGLGLLAIGHVAQEGTDVDESSLFAERVRLDAHPPEGPVLGPKLRLVAADLRSGRAAREPGEHRVGRARIGVELAPKVADVLLPRVPEHLELGAIRAKDAALAVEKVHADGRVLEQVGQVSAMAHQILERRLPRDELADLIPDLARRGAVLRARRERISDRELDDTEEGVAIEHREREASGRRRRRGGEVMRPDRALQCPGATGQAPSLLDLRGRR